MSKIRKNKINACELAATTNYRKISKENIIEQENVLINNKNEQTFEIRREIEAIFKSLVTLTIYNW